MKKTVNRVSETYVDEEKKIFIKVYNKRYPKTLISSEFEKSKKIYALLNKESKKLCKTPKPISIDLKKRTIVYEFIPDFIEIKDFFLKNNSIFSSDWNDIKKVIEKVTYTIKYIHDNLKLGKTEAIKGFDSDKKTVNLLGDICNSNILISKKEIYLIDFSPSYYMFPAKTCNIKGSPYLDLACLIYTFNYPPIWHKPLYLNKYREYEELVVKTYFKGENLFDAKLLNKAKNYYSKRYLKSLKGSLTYPIWNNVIKREIRRLENGL